MLSVVVSYSSYLEYKIYVFLFTIYWFTKKVSREKRFYKQVGDAANCLIYNVVENGASQKMLFGILMGHFLVNLSLVTLILQKLLALGKLNFIFNTLVGTKERL